MSKEQMTWNASLYDHSHSFVSSYGEDLVTLLSPQKDEDILDLGCGTGDLSNQIHQSGADVVGVDKSSSMIEKARAKYPSLPFDVQDVTELDHNHRYDAVFSNATLHWVQQPELALQNLFKSLKPGGRFVAEFGGKSNVRQITDELMKQLQSVGISHVEERFPWYYPSVAEYTTLMERVGFRVTLAMHFDRPTPLIGEEGLRNWINMFGGSFFVGLSAQEIEDVLSKTEESLRPTLYKDGQWIADYKRIRVVGIKE